MKYKLIACDLDETLLNKDHGISQRNIELIHKAQALGVKFVPATGRLFTGVKDVLEILGLNDLEAEYVISANGGILTENKNSRILKSCGLTFEKTKELFEFGKQFDICVQIHTLENIYMYNLNDDEENRVINQGVSYEKLISDNIDCLKDKNIIKVLYQTTDVAYLESIEPKLKDITDNEVSVSYSSSRYMELNQLGIDKGKGLVDLTKMLNISLEETIAIGDHYNDESMLRIAGLSVAANNAIDDIKKICDYVCHESHNEGVVAEVIEKFIL